MNLRSIHRYGQACQARQACRGMVLFEVVMALFIFTLVAFSLVMALDSAFDAAEERNDIDMALRGLENQTALLHAARLLPGERDMPDDGSGFLYHVAVTQEQMQDQKHQPLQNMYRATITATWKSRGHAQERDVTELIYQP
jgi:type II secretory pathway component PulJ